MFLVLQNQILISFIRAELFYLSEALLTSVEVQTDLSENTKICLLNLEKEKKKHTEFFKVQGRRSRNKHGAYSLSAYYRIQLTQKLAVESYETLVKETV